MQDNFGMADETSAVLGTSEIAAEVPAALFAEDLVNYRNGSLDSLDGDRESSRLLDGGDESAPPSGDTSGDISTDISASITSRLYLSHFLSTWNARMFEFAAVLFLAAIYPHTLRPVSVYAVVRGLAAITGAEAVGACIDGGDRLAVVRASIVGQRAAVAVSFCVFAVMMGPVGAMSGGLEALLFVVAVLAACLEKLCAVANLVAVERDWVVVMTEGNEGGRRLLNARMRRIDLFCKLAGPLAIALVASVSVIIAVWVTLAVNVVSVSVEYFCIAVVYRRVPALRRPTRSTAGSDQDSDITSRQSLDTTSNSGTATTLTPPRYALAAGLRRLLPLSSMPFYVRHRAFLPSLALALLYWTVLSFSGQMVTFLLAVGYRPRDVGLVRTASTLLELSATWVVPRLVSVIGDIRGGIWSLSWQSLWLTAGVTWFYVHGGVAQNSDSLAGIASSARASLVAGMQDYGIFRNNQSLVAATGLALGVAMSRVGLWSFDLCAQSIVQEEVEAEHRGVFSTAEAALQNLFEVLSYATTMVFARPDQFQWPVAISITAVYTSAALYAAFVRQRRGHLFHSPLPPAQRWIDKTFRRSYELTTR